MRMSHFLSAKYRVKKAHLVATTFATLEGVLRTSVLLSSFLARSSASIKWRKRSGSRKLAISST